MDLSRIPILGRRKEDEEQWYYHTDFTARVREVKAEFKVYLRQRGMQVHWIVTDVDPQGAEYIAMTVQEPNGMYRPFDGRTLETLRQITHRGPDANKLIAEFEEKERLRKLATEKHDDDIAHGVAEDLKWAGTDVTPSVAWRERSLKKVADDAAQG